MNRLHRILALALCAALALALCLPAFADDGVFDVTADGAVADVTDAGGADTADAPDTPDASDASDAAVSDVTAAADAPAAVADISGGTPLALTPVDPDTLGVKRLSELYAEADGVQSEPETEPERDENESVYVLIYLDGDSAIAAGYPVEGIGENADADAYRDYLAARQDAVTAAIESAVGYDIGVDWGFTLLFNAVSATVRYGDIDVIASVPGVQSVEIQEPAQPGEDVGEDAADGGADTVQTATSSGTTGASSAWDAGYTGAGSLIAIIDTGLDTSHAAVNGGAFAYAIDELEAEFGYTVDLLEQSELSGVMSGLNASALGATASKVYVSAKIPFAYNYCDKNYQVGHIYDSQGNHGSHVAGIAAANRYVPSLQSDTDYTEASYPGMAPDAQLVIMKVFGRSETRSGYASTYMAALEDAVTLGCDVINMSLGSTSAGFSIGTDSLAAFNTLADSGIVVTISCGNSYGWNNQGSNTGSTYIYADDVSMDTVSRPASFTDSLAVAASAKSESTTVSVQNLTMSGFSSWGVPGSLLLKPEITAPGGSITSIQGRTSSYGSTSDYTSKNGTSMAAPHIAGLAAVLAQAIRESGLTAATGLTARQLTNSLLMSTAIPLVDASSGQYVSVLKQGAGLAQIDAAIAAQSYILMGADATGSYADGKVKAELGQDADRAGVYGFSFTINNMSGSARTYALSGSIFTQDVYTSGGVSYMAESTTGLDASVTFSTGGSVTVPAGGSADVTVTIALTDASKAWLNESFKTAYIEGYVFAVCGSEAHSIPILGAYGSWTDSSMFDTASRLDDYFGTDYNAPYGGNTSTNAVYVRYAGMSYASLYTGNDYIKEKAFPADRLALRNGDTVSTITYTLLRNACSVGWAVTDESGTALALGTRTSDDYNVIGMYYNKSWQNASSQSLSPSVTVSSLGLEEDASFTVGVYAIPEYYAMVLSGGTSGTLTDDQLRTVLASRDSKTALGRGAYIGCTITVDNTAPVIGSAVLNEDGTVTFTLADNQYIACLELQNSDNDVLAQLVPDQTGAGQTVTYTFDPDKADAAVTDCQYAVFVGDYAGNEAAATFSLHDYRADWTWNNDHTAASLKLICESCGDTQTPAAAVTAAVTPASCETAGESVYTATAVYGGVTYTDTRRFPIAATGHSYTGPVWSWEADYSAASAAFTCENCGDGHAFASTPTAAVTPASCTVDGHADYTASVSFGGVTYTDTRSVTLPAAGHDYRAEWSWAEDYSTATATLTCAVCGSVVTATDGNVIADVREPTDLIEGRAVYTASVVVDGVTYTGAITVVTPALGHAFTLTGWTWADDYSAASAAFACTHEDCGETAKAEAAVNAVTDPATCTEPGSAEYTATVVFDGVTYTDVKTAVIPAAGHSYALTGWSWNDDYTAASASFTCPACGASATVDAVVTSVTTEATYTAAGGTVYTAVASFNGGTYTDTRSVTLPKKEVTLRHTLTLDGKIGIKFYVFGLDEAYVPNTRAVFSRDGETLSESPLLVLENSNYCYFPATYVAAREMTDGITMELYVGDSLAATETYSVTDYTSTVLSGGSTNKKLISLCKAMLDYGSYAQLYFGYNTDNLANGGTDYGLMEVPSGIGASFDKDVLNASLNETGWGISYVGSTLTLESGTNLNLYFSGSGWEELTVTIDGDPASFEEVGGYQELHIDDIAAKNLGDTHTFVLSDGKTEVTLQYSAYNYVNTALQSSATSTYLKNLCRAIYGYCEAAKVYFNYTSA